MVSDWHILPILHTSFASFLVQVQGRCGNFFFETSYSGIGSELLSYTTFGNNKQKQ
jgi:hypothetical protein